MNDLYVVAIGGSGERVMRSLIMTLASGVTLPVNRVVPVFVENDVDSYALNKCLELIKYYGGREPMGGLKGVNVIYSALGDDPNVWPSFCRTKIADPIILNRAGDTIGTLSAVIGSYDANDPIYKRVDEEKNLLFSNEDLDMPLTVGFVGNPNIGSVVLNSLSLSDIGFQNITAALSPNDGLIVVGSLFGGTGAAGIPLIINAIKALPPANHPILGTVAVLPYFTTDGVKKRHRGIDTNRWDVSPETFDTKTRAALMYYDDYMAGHDYTYYVGDGDAKDSYAHCVGGSDQSNRSHLVELMGALSIIDFSKQVGRPGNITYKRPIWGINEINDNNNKIATNFSGIRNVELAKALAKFQMMKQIFTAPELLQYQINKIKNNQPTSNIGFTETMRLNVVVPDNDKSSVEAWGLNHILQEWDKWMNELGSDNAKRKFQIYNNATPATDNNLIHNFYVESTADVGKGIAKNEMRRPSGLKNIFSDKVPVPMDAEVAEAMLTAYSKLYPNGSPSDAANYSEDQRLPRLLQVISLAIDNIIKDRCWDSLSH